MKELIIVCLVIMLIILISNLQNDKDVLVEAKKARPCSEGFYPMGK